MPLGSDSDRHQDGVSMEGNGVAVSQDGENVKKKKRNCLPCGPSLIHPSQVVVTSLSQCHLLHLLHIFLPLIFLLPP